MTPDVATGQLTMDVVPMQVAASHAAGYSHPSQLDLQPPGAPPTLRLNQNQDLAAEQPDDWAQFINMDAEADGDGQHPGEDDRDPLQTHEVTQTLCCCSNGML